MARLLVIAREASEASRLADHLAEAGHAVTSSETGRDGMRRAEEAPVDLVIVSMSLPDISGTELCRLIRASAAIADVPIIMLSSSDDEIDRVVGFEVGADDFIVRPYSLRELSLRVRAVLRRKHKPRGPLPVAQVGGLHLDPLAQRVLVEGSEVALSALEFKLLTTLYQRRHRVQTRSLLLEEVWGAAENISARTVDACVKRLRQKLGSAGHYIQTVRGVGYRFIGEELVGAQALSSNG